MRRAAAVVVLGCLLAAGCGNSRTPVPSLTRPAAAHGYRTLRFPAAGVSISAPGGWPVIPERAPLVTVVTSGDAVIALWRYPRPQAPPASAAALSAARNSLFAAVRLRRGSVRVISSRITRVDGAPTIEFNALESIAGRRRQVLSTHVFTAGGEVVLEEYAPPRTFTSIHRQLFARVRSSLAVIGASGSR